MLRKISFILCLIAPLSVSAQIIDLNDFSDIDRGFDKASDKAALMHLATTLSCEVLYAKPPIDKSGWYYLQDPKDTETRFQRFCWYLKAAQVDGKVDIDPDIANAWIENNFEKIMYLSSVDSVVDKAKHHISIDVIGHDNDCYYINVYADQGHEDAINFRSMEVFEHKCKN